MSRQWGEASEAEDATAAGELLLEQADDYAARAGRLAALGLAEGSGRPLDSTSVGSM